jgi:hypothetical protein
MVAEDKDIKLVEVVYGIDSLRLLVQIGTIFDQSGTIGNHSECPISKCPLSHCPLYIWSPVCGMVCNSI